MIIYLILPKYIYYMTTLNKCKDTWSFTQFYQNKHEQVFNQVFFSLFIYLFLERDKEGEREGSINMLLPLKLPYWGPGPQRRCVP